MTDTSESILGRGGFVVVGDQDAAERYLFALPDGYEGRTLKTDAGKWAVSYRFARSGDSRLGSALQHRTGRGSA